MERIGVQLVALGLAGLAMAPLRHALPPLLDFPEHAATIATLVDLWRGGPLSAWYETDFLHTQYWLMAVVGALLAPLVGGPAAALKLLLAASGIGLVAALLRLTAKLGLDERLVVAAVPLLWSRPFTLGFVAFVLATPLVVLALAELAAPDPPSRKGHAVVALLALAIFFLNLASVVWLVAAALAMALTREPPPARWGRALKRVQGLGVLVVPSLAWVAFGAVTNVDAARFAVSMEGRWWSPLRLLREAPGWLMDRWSGDVDGVLLAVLVLAIVAGLLPVGTPTPTDGRRPLKALVFSTFVLCLGLPFERGWLWGLSARFLPMALTLTALAASWRPASVRRVLFGVFVAVSLVSIWDVDRHVAAAQEELAGLAMLRGLPAGTRLLQLTFDDRSAQVQDSTVGHAGAWHRVWNLGPNEPSFVDLPQSVLRYRPGKAPWMRPWPWEFSPEGYDNAREGPFYDFVLTHGDGPSFPPAANGGGPAWRLRETSGAFRLWERAPSTP